LELVVYARDDLAEPRGPAFHLYPNTGPRMAHHAAYDPSDNPRFWFVLDVAIGRAAGRALAGPPAAEVLPELPAPARCCATATLAGPVRNERSPEAPTRP
jgi:hypothetical protein